MAQRSNANTAEKYFAEISTAQFTCLAYSHVMPVLIPGERIPRGVTMVPDMRLVGCMRITEHCLRDCDVHRISTTLPGFRFNKDEDYQYVYGDRWVLRPDNLILTPRDFRAEIYRRARWE